MQSSELQGRTETRLPGPLSRALIRLLMRRATVVAVEQLAPRFRLITLEGDALKGVAWTPGEKVQVAMGSAFVARTYTPIEWNAAAGRTCILAFEHGDGPGSQWVRTVGIGDECDLFGPRSSVAFDKVTGPIALFGDETSIGLAYALKHRSASEPASMTIEVDDVDNVADMLGHLGLPDVALLRRSAGGAHFKSFEFQIPALIDVGASFVLTGKAQSIQRVRTSIKRVSDARTGIVTKAYWAPGKTGLD